jgi:hypothetical protein
MALECDHALQRHRAGALYRAAMPSCLAGIKLIRTASWTAAANTPAGPRH